MAKKKMSRQEQERWRKIVYMDDKAATSQASRKKDVTKLTLWQRFLHRIHLN
ncbi:hypothetical protein [Levilactobacillus bambusae]|uniref:hypothetical protein n=1 Tax=Levilactobacillus bambusae TaxID=2024736 RepID=UPI0014032CCF|nr:hypothetical protein [Levilactobacillus bambusae]